MNLFNEYVSLDLGTHSIKVFSISSGPGNQGFQIDTILREPLPAGLVCGGFTNPTIRSISLFSQFLETVIPKIKNLKEGMIIGIPDRWVKLHVVELALKPEQVESSEYLAWRLKKMVCPPGIDDVLVDPQVLSCHDSDEGKVYRVMVGLVQKSIIGILSNLFIEMNVQVMSFDTSTLGVYNLLEEAFPERTIDRQLIVCHVGHETTVIKVFDHGILRYERVIEVAGEAFGKLLAEAEGIPLADAFQEIPQRVFFPSSREDLLRQISRKHLFEKVFGNWLRELHVTFRFFQDKFKVVHLPPIFLTGGSCLFHGLPEFLSDFFETTCQVFNPLRHLPLSAELDPKIIAEGPLNAPSMGLLVQ